MNNNDNKEVETVRLGLGKAFLGLYTSPETTPTITIGRFKDTKSKREVGRDCKEEPYDALFRLEFPNRDSLKVLRRYLNKIEALLETEELLVELYSEAMYYSDVVEGDL